MLRTDDLFINNYKIIQDTDSFCFGTDAVLLAHFAKVKRKDFVCDIGSGNGIIPLLLCGLYNPCHIDGFEIQENSFNLFAKNINLNSLDEKISPINIDINLLSDEYNEKYDVVVTNPPYKKALTGIENPTDAKKIARHEIFLTLENLIKKSSEILKQNGRFYMINRPERLCETLNFMEKYNVIPKNLCFVHSKISKRPKMFLIEGRKSVNDGLVIMPPIYLFDENNNESEISKRIYSFMREGKNNG